MHHKNSKEPPFWQTKTLAEMTRSEWELLCDGCAKCCLNKFIDDEHTDETTELLPTDHINPGEQVFYSNIACHLLNEKSCQCSKYEQRTKLVPDCVRLTQDNIDDLFLMPPSCTYRRLQEGRGIPSWHPLVNKGKKSAMHKMGMSVRGKIVKDNDVDIENFENYIVSWPLNDVK
jgi:hypothetical protein